MVKPEHDKPEHNELGSEDLGSARLGSGRMQFRATEHDELERAVAAQRESEADRLATRLVLCAWESSASEGQRTPHRLVWELSDTVSDQAAGARSSTSAFASVSVDGLVRHVVIEPAHQEVYKEGLVEFLDDDLVDSRHHEANRRAHALPAEHPKSFAAGAERATGIVPGLHAPPVQAASGSSKSPDLPPTSAAPGPRHRTGP